MVNKELLDMIDGKYRRKYAEIYGIESLINIFHGLPWNDDESERVYSICLKKKITWEEYYDVNKEGKIY